MNIPGFTAETSCYLASTMYYQVGSSGYCETMPAVAPQLWSTVPFWKTREDGTVYYQEIPIWSDDPGGWEMNPEIGALTDRQARARCIVNCSRVNSKNRADCIESCGE